MEKPFVEAEGTKKDAIPLATFEEFLGQHIGEALSTLTEMEKRVIKLRFGRHGETKRTLEEIGQGFGLTREKVRQIEGKALRKLQHPNCLGKEFWEWSFRKGVK
jgi:RNA polymerase primary sigma factor